MKTIVTILLTLITFSAISQITLPKRYEWVNDSSFWYDIKEITAVQGNAEAVDTISYIFNKVPDMFAGVRYNKDVVYNNDSTVRFINTNQTRLVVYRSRKATIQTFVRKEIYKEVELTNDEKITQYLLKAKELGVKNNNTFWNYPPIDSIVNPDKYILLNDTIQ